MRKLNLVLTSLLLVCVTTLFGQANNTCLCDLTLVSNGCFEVGDDPCVNTWTNTTGVGTPTTGPVLDWGTTVGTPDLYDVRYACVPGNAFTIPLSTTLGISVPVAGAGIRYMGLRVDNGGTTAEGMYVNIPAGLVPGQQYYMTMKVRSVNQMGQLRVSLTNGVPVNTGVQTVPHFNVVTNSNNPGTINQPIMVNSPGAWMDLTFCINPSSFMDHLVIESQFTMSSTSIILVDDIQIVNTQDVSMISEIQLNCGNQVTGPDCEFTSTGASYSWAPGTGLSANNIPNPTIQTGSAGQLYTLTTTFPGCINTVQSTVTVVAPLTLVTTPSPPSSGCNGSVSTTVTDGKPGYTYSWNIGATTPIVSSSPSNVLCAGTYCVTVTDAMGCTASSCETLTGPMDPPSYTQACPCDVDNEVENGCFESGYDYNDQTNQYLAGVITPSGQGVQYLFEGIQYSSNHASQVDFWTPVGPVLTAGQATPDLYINTPAAIPNPHPYIRHPSFWSMLPATTNTSSPNERFIGLGARHYTSGVEGVQTALKSGALVAGQDYFIRFKAYHIVGLQKNSPSSPGPNKLVDELNIFFHDGPAATIPAANSTSSKFSPVDPTSTTNTYVEADSGIWKEFTICFTAPTGNFDHLVFEPKANPSEQWLHWFFIDDVELYKKDKLADAGPDVCFPDPVGTTAPLSCVAQTITGISYAWTAPNTGSGMTFSNPTVRQTGLTGTPLAQSDLARLSVTIPGAPGCVLTDDAIVRSVQLGYSKIDETCTGACDGVINLSVSSAGTSFTYTWGGAWSGTTTVPTLSGACAGTYSVTVTDNFGCSAVLNGMVVGSQSTGTGFPITSNNASFFDAARDIVVASNGDVYVCGDFEGNTNILSTSVPGGGGSGNTHMFVAKFDFCGNLLWVNYSTGSFADGRGLTLDENNDFLFVTGNYNDIVITWHGQNGTSLQNTLLAGDIYVAKYDASGTATDGNILGLKLDITSQPSPNGLGYSATSTAIEVNSNGDVYICGYGQSGPNFNDHYFIAQLDGALNFVRFDNPGISTALTDKSWANGIEIDQTNNEIYVVGSFFEEIVLYTGINGNHGTNTNLVSNLNASEDGFVVKYDASLNDQWINNFSASDFGEANDVVLDGTDLYVVGCFYTAPGAFVNPFNVTSSSVISGMNKAGWINMLDANNGTGQWFQQYQNSHDISFVDVTFDGSDVFVAGNDQFIHSPFRNNIPKFSFVPSTVFTRKYNTGGTFQWMQSASNTTGALNLGIATHPSLTTSQIYTCGYYDDALTFNSTINRTPGGANANLFIARQDPALGAYRKASDDNATAVEAFEKTTENGLGVKIFPNPNNGHFTIRLTGSASEGKMVLINAQGKEVWSQPVQENSETDLQLDLALSEGIYILQYSNAVQVYRQKVVISR